MIDDFDAQDVIGQDHDLKFFHKWDCPVFLECSEFFLIIEVNQLWIIWPLEFTLNKFVKPGLLLLGSFHLCKVSIPVDALKRRRIINVSIELSEDDVEALQDKAFCVGLINDRMRFCHGQGASQLYLLCMIFLDHPAKHSEIKRFE